MATYVLVHGMGSGGWLWDPVAGMLREAGHTVFAPTLVGVGERASEGGPETDLTTHVQQIVSLIRDQPASRIVLVGFSYSGTVVEGVAAAIPDRIATLVLVDAFVAPNGACGFDRMSPPVVQQLRAAAKNEGDGWKLPPMPLEGVGGIGSVEQGISVTDVERTLDRRGTHPIGTYEGRVSWDESLLAGVERHYIICTGKPAPLRERSEAEVRELREAGFAVDELSTGHFPMQSTPKALAALLMATVLTAAD